MKGCRRARPDRPRASGRPWARGRHRSGERALRPQGRGPYWQSNPWNREDIIQAGRCGLLYALREKFDPTLGYELTTYARAWIEHYAQRWLRDKRQPIRVPVGAQEKRSLP